MMHWLKEQSLLRMLQYTLELQDFGRKYTEATIRGIVGMRQLIRDWPDFEKQFGQGKYLLNPLIFS